VIGMQEADTAARYRRFAEVEVRPYSPSYERLCLGVAGDATLLARLAELPAPKRQPNLLLAAVRYLDGPVGSYPAFREFVLSRWSDVATTMLARRTQTNEPGRCAPLLPVLAALPQPLALIEVGASAGLCLYPDRYAYRYTLGDLEQRVGTSPVLLRCAADGPVPLPSAAPGIAWRAGLDLNPLDVRDDEDVRWLESLIWPEQSERFDVLRGAVELARADPPRIVRGDLLRDLPALAAEASDEAAEATLVVFHTAVLGYVDAAGRAAFTDTMRSLDATWISNEMPGLVPGTDVDTGGAARIVLARDQRPIALARAHGQSLTWLP
jgi:hypothetical protein